MLIVYISVCQLLAHVEGLLTDMCPRNFLMALPVETSVSMTSLSAAPLTIRLLSAALEHNSGAYTVNVNIRTKMSGYDHRVYGGIIFSIDTLKAVLSPSLSCQQQLNYVLWLYSPPPASSRHAQAVEYLFQHLSASRTSCPCPMYVLRSRPEWGFQSFTDLSLPQVRQ